MRTAWKRVALALLTATGVVLAGSDARGQFETREKAGVSWGIRGGVSLPRTELADSRGLMGSSYLRLGLIPRLELEVNGGFGEAKGPQYETLLSFAEARIILGLNTFGDVSPFLYAGAGALRFDVSDLPPTYVQGYPTEGWTKMVPAGGGLRIRLTENVAIEGSGGITYTFKDVINGDPTDKGNDMFWRIAGGITVGSFGKPARKHAASRPTILPPPPPLPPWAPPPPKPVDSDGDGLTDEEETTQFGTDPTLADTDGDGLRDGAEARRYTTDPTREDTDGGSVGDGVEVRRGSDPLDPADDVPKPAPETPGPIQFGPSGFWVTPSMLPQLDALAAWLADDPGVRILLRGHSDSSARTDYNLWLSRQRARAVRNYLIEKGIDPGRIRSEGVGDAEPAASNTTEEGRRKNRRVEIRESQ